MATSAARPGDGPVACRVARGGDAASTVGVATAGLWPSLAGRAVVLVRLSQPTPVTAQVVHELVDLLLEGGCSHVCVAGALTTGDRDRGHRSAVDLARAAGLTQRTGRGAAYEFIDPAATTIAAPVPPGSVLAGQQVSAAWASAPVRLVVARSLTEAADGYAGCLAALLGAAPSVPGADPADVATDLLALLPPALAVVDALVSSHGPDGARLPRWLDTGAVVASTDALLADTVLASLQGEDRSASRLTARALARLGEPPGRVEGDLTPFPGWQRVHPGLREGTRRAMADPGVARVLAAAVGGPDPGAAAVDPVLDAVRAVLTPIVGAADGEAGRIPLAGVHGALAAAAQAARGWSASLDKDTVERVTVPLGFDPGRFSDTDYDELPGFLLPFERMLDGLPRDGERMRWRLVDGATVFEVSREVPASFAEFTARVDVAAGISLMADYLGGVRVTTGEDGRGLPVRQAERNLYLPQPNYLAGWGGLPIDVCKIELVVRAEGVQRLHWRTVASPNGSAVHDDGTLELLDTGTGSTRVTVRGRQLFTLPTAWGGIDLAAVPEVRDPLLEEAYRRFFTTTFDNLEACFEGRPFRIGRPAATGAEPLPTAVLGQLGGAVLDWWGEKGQRTGGNPRPEPVAVDIHGFSHFRGPS